MSFSAVTSIAIPTSKATVTVKILRSFDISVATPQYFISPAPGSRSDESTPLYLIGNCFLLEHLPSGTKLVFDLGFGGREDVEAHGDIMRHALEGIDVYEHYNVADALEQGGVKKSDISAIIWR
jgi:hypothetical protein